MAPRSSKNAPIRGCRTCSSADRSWPRPASRRSTRRGDGVRLVIARCSVDYEGRLTAHLPLATRLLLVKADGSVLVHSDGGSYKPLNWMSPPCSLSVAPAEGVREQAGAREVWTVRSGKTD